MSFLHSLNYTLELWGLQFLSAAGLAMLLPRSQWAFRVLCAVGAVADVTELLIPNGTNAYGYVYWGFRTVELNWAVYAVSDWCCGLVPKWCENKWLPVVIAGAVTLGTGLPSSNEQMRVYQTIMLLLIAGTALMAAWLWAGIGRALLALAIGLTFALQLACTVLWRVAGYSSDIWLITWITGCGMIWWASRQAAVEG